MSFVYVTEQQAWIRKAGKRLVVEKEGTELMEIPWRETETVLVFGNVQVASQALRAMLDQGIELAILSRNGQLRGQVTPVSPRNFSLRMRQYEAARDERLCLSLAREVVAAKIESSAAVLRRYRMNHPDAVSLEDIRDLDSRVPAARAASSLETLRGIEGAAAARSFRALAGMVPPAFAFHGRNRRPPRDPVNALLSFGYVRVGNELQSLLDAMGFEPYLGFYHQSEYGRPSLALDLLEEFRAALVDRFSLRLLNLGILKPGDFVTSPEKGIRLTAEALEVYIEHYEKELTSTVSSEGEALPWRHLFRRQAERLARALRQDEPYRAFRLEG